MIINWLSQKINIVLSIVLVYVMVYYMLWDKLTSNQLIIITILLLVLSFLCRLLGVARGLLICAIDEEYFKYMKKLTKDITDE